MTSFIGPLLPQIEQALPRAEQLYKDFHQHPELSHQEARTAAIAAAQLREAGFQVVEKVGGTGVVGLLENGAGPTVMLRADMDALPIREQTGLAYASACEGVNAQGEPVPVSHACGHDMHLAWALAAGRILAEARPAWRGSLLIVCQPAEETGTGSQGMLDDGMTARFPRPDVIFGQHLLQYRTGTLACRPGQLLTAGDSFQVRFFGAGGHGGMPQNAIDPIVMAAAAVLRLQAVVAREVPPQAQAVVTVGEFHAGHAENIIPAEAVLKLNVRTTDLAVRERLLAAIRRVCLAEAQASNAPREPEFTDINNYPLTFNDVEVTRRVTEAFRAAFGDRVTEASPVGASEDFGRFGQAWGAPYCYWFVGGCPADTYDEAERLGTLAALPGPHSPFWAPALHPTLRTGIEALLTAAGAWLAPHPLER